MGTFRYLPVAFCAGVLACAPTVREGGDIVTSAGSGSGDGDGDQSSTTAGDGDDSDGESGGDSGTGASGDSGGDGDGSGGTDGGIRFDVGEGGGTSGGEAGGAGCKNIDFLFVIDNSGSMGDEQRALTQAFPGFIASIQNTVDANDYHVMVVDTDAGSDGGGNGSGCSTNAGQTDCTCSPAPDCCDTICAQQGPNATCNGFTCSQPIPDPEPPEPCDITIGAGISKDSLFMACGFDSGLRYMDQAETALVDKFVCAAQVGTTGNAAERPMDALTEALGAQSGGGQCNEGFLRDDAILVITVITDEPDEDSAGGPQAWIDAVVAAKNGDPQAIVALGLIGDSDVPGGICPPLSNNFGASAAPQLRAFIEGLPFGVAGSICSDDYASFFDAAVATIDSSCEDFVPPG